MAQSCTGLEQLFGHRDKMERCVGKVRLVATYIEMFCRRGVVKQRTALARANLLPALHSLRFPANPHIAMHVLVSFSDGAVRV